MKILLTISILIIIASCSSERHFFERTLSSWDKAKLKAGDTIVKHFNGKVNAQFWRGDLKANSKGNRHDFWRVGQWVQTDKSGRAVFAITHYIEHGVADHEVVMEYDGTPDVEYTFTPDTIEKKTVVRYEMIFKYKYTNIIKTKESYIRIKRKRMRDGISYYYDETGNLKSTIEYKRGKKVKAH